MSDTRDSQDVAESLDPDVMPDYDDPTGTLQYPPERPLGVNQYGVAAAEERVDEPLEERVRREVVDPLDEIDEPDDDTMGAIEAEALDPYPVIDDDLVAQLTAPPVQPGDRSTLDDDLLDNVDGTSVGRLVAPGGDDPILADDEAQAVAQSVDEPDLSAEEEAVHLD